MVPLPFSGEDAVRLRGEHHRSQVPSLGLHREQRLARRPVVDPHQSRRIPGGEALVPLREAQRDDGTGMPFELVHPCQPSLPAPRRRDDLPCGHPPGAIAHHQSPVADEKAQGRHGRAGAGRDRRALGQPGILPVAHVVVQHLPRRGSDEQVLGSPIERQGGHRSGTLDVQSLKRLLARARPDQGLLLDHRLHDQLRGADLGHRQGTRLGRRGRETHDGPRVHGIERRRRPEDRLRRHGPLAVLEDDVEPSSRGE